MSIEKEHLEINKNSWNNRLQSHLDSDFYFLDDFIKGKNSLNNIELELLGNITNKRILHLQCHFGQDTISLSRMGAKCVGVDLSDKSIEKGIELAKLCNTNTEFVCSNVYDYHDSSNEKFDIVFTTYGTISWLPDLEKWANLISKNLKKGGELIFVEFHPVIWMFDDDVEKVGYNYFNDGPQIEEESGTYADQEADIRQSYVNWNHSISEVVTSLLSAGLTIEHLGEYDYSPYPFIAKTIESENGKYRVEHTGNKIPLVYSIKARL